MVKRRMNTQWQVGMRLTILPGFLEDDKRWKKSINISPETILEVVGMGHWTAPHPLVEVARLDRLPFAFYYGAETTLQGTVYDLITTPQTTKLFHISWLRPLEKCKEREEVME